MKNIGATTELREALKNMLMVNEGVKSKPYLCSKNYTSVGVGRNLDTVGLREDEIMYLLENDIDEVISGLNREFPEWQYLPHDARLVICDMTFNLGIKGLMKFKNMISCLLDEDFEGAAYEIENSRYYSQVKKRAMRNIALLLEMDY